MGPLLQAGRYGHIGVHQELNVQGLFSILGTGRLISYLCMGCVQLWILFGSLEGRLRFQFVAFLLFPRSTPLPGSRPQHRSSLGRVISHAGQVKYFA